MRAFVKYFFCAFSIAAVSPLKAKDFSYGWKGDPYYTYASCFLNFRDEKLVNLDSSETALYQNLLKKSLQPTTLLVEFFGSPLPYLAAYMKTNHPSPYGKFDISDTANVLNALTAGEEDPWGASVFLGKIVPFKPAGRSKGYTGIAYSGGLLTLGRKHMKGNLIYDDSWYQIEWKIKGLRITRIYKQFWSFRAGLKEHNNPCISDVYYVSLYRDRTDFYSRGFSFWRNSVFDVYAGFRRSDFNPVKLSVLLGRNFPSKLKNKRLTYSFSAGVLWEGENKYFGYMKETDKTPKLQFILRPTVKF